MPTLPKALSPTQRTLALLASVGLSAAVLAANLGLAQTYAQAAERATLLARRPADHQLAAVHRACSPVLRAATGQRCAQRTLRSQETVQA